MAKAKGDGKPYKPVSVGDGLQMGTVYWARGQRQNAKLDREARE